MVLDLMGGLDQGTGPLLNEEGAGDWGHGTDAIGVGCRGWTRGRRAPVAEPQVRGRPCPAPPVTESRRLSGASAPAGRP